MHRALADETFEAIAALMHRTVGLSFGPAKKALVVSRLAPRLQRLGLQRFEDYLALIDAAGQDDELQMAVDLLTTHETYFLREPVHFELLAQVFGPGGVGRQRPAPPAVWSAAASFGDEAYSIAMVLADLQARGHVQPGWSVLGTDISDHVLRAATEAIYPEERLRHVPLAWRQRYCLRGEGDCEGLVQIHPRLAAQVRFGQLNLCQPVSGLGPFDVVFLRNVLIYFDAPTKRRVVDNVLTQLRPGGLLFVGTAESRLLCDTPLLPLGPGAFGKPA